MSNGASAPAGALGDVADSPLIQARKREEMAYRGGLLVVRRLAFD